MDRPQKSAFTHYHDWQLPRGDFTRAKRTVRAPSSGPVCGLRRACVASGKRTLARPMPKTGVVTMTTENNASASPIRSAVAELLDVRAVAALLGGCSTRHVYRLADAGKMPRPLKLGQLVRWRRAELLRWLGEGCPPVRSTRGAVR